MADTFPAARVLSNYLTSTVDVTDATHGRAWLISSLDTEGIVKIQCENLPATHRQNRDSKQTKYSIYSTDKNVFIPVIYDCTFNRLKNIFGNDIQARIIRRNCYQDICDFLAGAQGTPLLDWTLAFSPQKVKFSQNKLNQFCLRLKIDDEQTLTLIYSSLQTMYNSTVCRKLGLDIEEGEADLLFNEHKSNSRAFNDLITPFNCAQNAVRMKKVKIDFLDLKTVSNLEMIQGLCDDYDLRDMLSPEKNQENICKFLEDRIGENEIDNFCGILMDMYRCAFRKQCIMLSGTYQTGKTTMSDLLLCPFDYVTIDPNKTDSFWLENACDKRAILFDDVTLEGLQLLEDKAPYLDGHLTTEINRKHKSRKRQRFPPSIITTNIHNSNALHKKLFTRCIECKIVKPMSPDMISISSRIIRYSKEDKISGLIHFLQHHYVGSEDSILDRSFKVRAVKRPLFQENHRQNKVLRSSPVPSTSTEDPVVLEEEIDESLTLTEMLNIVSDEDKDVQDILDSGYVAASMDVVEEDIIYVDTPAKPYSAFIEHECTVE